MWTANGMNAWTYYKRAIFLQKLVNSHWFTCSRENFTECSVFTVHGNWGFSKKLWRKICIADSETQRNVYGYVLCISNEHPGVSFSHSRICIWKFHRVLFLNGWLSYQIIQIDLCFAHIKYEKKFANPSWMRRIQCPIKCQKENIKLIRFDAKRISIDRWRTHLSFDGHSLHLRYINGK